MFQEKDIQFLERPLKAFLSIVKKIIMNYGYSKAEVDAAIASSSSGALIDQGFWNASTNSPALADTEGTQGHYYVVSVAGTQNLGSGSQTFSVGDWVYYNSADQWKIFETGVSYVPENVTNKEDTTLDTSTSKYPTNRLVKATIDALSSVYTTTAAVASQISTALSDYLTSATAASTYATISSLSSYLTTAAASAAYQVILTAANFGSFINGLTAKTTPVDADSLSIVDSAALNVQKKVTLTNFKAFLKTYFDTLYSGMPAGFVSAYAANSAPAGWLECNGAAVSRTTYATLFTAISTTHGTGDGSTTFNVPDYRGYFLRGWANGASVDSGRAFATTQTDAFQSHLHQETYATATGGSTGQVGGVANGNNASIAAVGSFTTAPTTDGANGTPRTSTETRPVNKSVMYCIKT